MRNNPPAPPVPNALIRLVLSITDPNVVVTEVALDYLSTSALLLSPAVLQAFITAWAAAHQTDLLNVVSDVCTLTTYQCADLNPGTTPTQTQTLVATGNVMAPPLPSVVAALISKGSTIKGQHGRGRNYIPCVPTSFVTPAVEANRLNASAVAAFANLVAGVQQPVTSGGVTWSPCIATRPITPATVPTHAAVVTTAVLQPLLATIRRRREGRGI